MIMAMILKTAKDWFIVVLCAALIITNFIPQALEVVDPILDWHGGNRLNMETDKAEYACGEMVKARFKVQKTREKVGSIKWALIDGPDSQIHLYTTRVADLPIGIYDHWVAVENLPQSCTPGKYHFEGVITYPVLFGSVSYTVRTTCFAVKATERK